MDSAKIDLYLASNARYFETHQIIELQNRLNNAGDDKWILLNSLELKDPQTFLIISIVGGYLGIDRFMLGETGLGVGKLLTGGGCGIWAIVDIFLIREAAKKKNWEIISSVLH